MAKLLTDNINFENNIDLGLASHAKPGSSEAAMQLRLEPVVSTAVVRLGLQLYI